MMLGGDNFGLLDAGYYGELTKHNAKWYIGALLIEVAFIIGIICL